MYCSDEFDNFNDARHYVQQVKSSRSTVTVAESFMESANMTSSGIDYVTDIPAKSPIKSGEAPCICFLIPFHFYASVLCCIAGEDRKGNRDVEIEKVDLILFRKKRFLKFWSFGFDLRRVKGEENHFTYVDVSSFNFAILSGLSPNTGRINPHPIAMYIFYDLILLFTRAHTHTLLDKETTRRKAMCSG